MAKNSVLKYLDFLELKGFIKKTNRCKEGEYTSNMYDVFVLSPDEQPSSPDEQPPSAGDEQPSSPDGNKLNPLTKSTSLTKSNEIVSNDTTPDGDLQISKNEIVEYGKKDINEVIEKIKEHCKECKVIYAPPPDERRYANFLLSKSFSEKIQEFDMDLYTFLGNIIKASSKLQYAKPANNAKAIYYNRGDIIDKAQKEKLRAESKQSEIKQVTYLS